jgi:hypothetical protein
VTQQNAALVEQSTGAYESLKEQMTRLADAVGGATAEPWRTLQERPGFGLGGRPGWRSGRVSAQRRTGLFAKQAVYAQREGDCPRSVSAGGPQCE